MSKNIQISEVLALPLEERLRLVEQIWDSISEVPEALALTDAQREILDARLEAHCQNPAEGSPRPEVKRRLLENRIQSLNETLVSMRVGRRA